MNAQPNITANQQKLILFTCLFASLALFNSHASSASLIGDEVSIRINIPNQGVDVTQTTTVTADASDALTFPGSGSSNFVVDPFDNGMVVTAVGFVPFGLTSGSSFTISDLDFTPPAFVTGLTSTDNWTLLSDTSTTITPDSAAFNFDTLNAAIVEPGQVMTLTLATRPIPEPASAVLLGLGGVALCLTRRRR